MVSGTSVPSVKKNTLCINVRHSRGGTSIGGCLLLRRRNPASIVWGGDTHSRRAIASLSILAKTVLVYTTLFCIGSRMLLLHQQVLICRLMIKPTAPELLILKDLQRSHFLGLPCHLLQPDPTRTELERWLHGNSHHFVTCQHSEGS